MSDSDTIKRRRMSQNARDAADRQSTKDYTSQVNEYRKDFIRSSKSALLPKGQQDTDGSNKNYETMLKNLEKKNAGQFEEMGDRFAKVLTQKDREIDKMKKGMTSIGKQNEYLQGAMAQTSERLKDVYSAMAKMSKSTGDKTLEDKKADDEAKIADPLHDFDITTPFSKDPLAEKKNVVENMEVTGPDVLDPYTPTAEQPEAEKTNETETVKMKLQVGQVVKVGMYNLTITNGFGPRTGDNAVAGITDGKHSRGVDYVAGGHVIAIDDGVVEGVYIQGTGEAYKPAVGKKASAGYYIRVRNPKTGMTTDYMHMDKIDDAEKAKLVGMQLSRGDSFWTAITGSGSQTRPHVKVSQWKNYNNRFTEKEQYDPSDYILK